MLFPPTVLGLNIRRGLQGVKGKVAHYQDRYAPYQGSCCIQNACAKLCKMPCAVQIYYRSDALDASFLAMCAYVCAMHTVTYLIKFAVRIVSCEKDIITMQLQCCREIEG